MSIGLRGGLSGLLLMGACTSGDDESLHSGSQLPPYTTPCLVDGVLTRCRTQSLDANLLHHNGALYFIIRLYMQTTSDIEYVIDVGSPVLLTENGTLLTGSALNYVVYGPGGLFVPTNAAAPPTPEATGPLVPVGTTDGYELATPTASATRGSLTIHAAERFSLADGSVELGTLSLRGGVLQASIHVNSVSVACYLLQPPAPCSGFVTSGLLGVRPVCPATPGDPRFGAFCPPRVVDPAVDLDATGGG